MEIKTKFDMGQKIYYFQRIYVNNRWKEKIVYGYVTTIFIDNMFEILYRVGMCEPMLYESSIFATEEEAEQKLKEIENEH